MVYITRAVLYITVCYISIKILCLRLCPQSCANLSNICNPELCIKIQCNYQIWSCLGEHCFHGGRSCGFRILLKFLLDEGEHGELALSWIVRSILQVSRMSFLVRVSVEGSPQRMQSSVLRGPHLCLPN